MSRDYIAHALKRLRETTGLTADEVGAKLGKSGKTVNAWENGRGQPDAEILIKLCSIYRVNNLLAEFDEENNIQKDPEHLSIQENELLNCFRELNDIGKSRLIQYLHDISKIIDFQIGVSEKPDTIQIRHSIYKVSAGRGFDLDDRDSWEEIEIPDTPEARKADFAVTIIGDSMEPIYSDGQIVLVREQPAVDIGETGVYIVNGGGFIKINGGNRLISINPKYDDISFNESDSVYCAGKVIGVV